MLDARSNTRSLIFKGLKKVKFMLPSLKPFFILFTAFIFLFNSVGGGLFTGESWAAKVTPGLPSVGPESTGSPTPLKNLSADTFTIPQELGYIQEAVNVQNSTRTVVHIQDAHCNYAAQRSISQILNYLTTEYGAYAVNCEGGAEGYDLSMFTDIPEKDIREKTSDFFVKEGIVSAAEFFAVNNPDKVKLWGVEDADLYIKDLKIYRDSLASKDEVERYLKSIGYILDNLKQHIYSQDLLKFDGYYTKYKDNKITFREYMTYLITTARKKLIDIKSFSNIYLLNQTLEQEEKIDFRRANNEKDEVVDKMKKVLSRNELEELMVKVGELKIERISQSDFYAYLVKKTKSIKLALSDYPELEKYIIYISMYGAIDRAAVPKEINTLEDRIAESMYENDTQRELGILSKNLVLMRNVFNISLTRDDYNYYKEHISSFGVSNFVKFIDSEAPLYKIQATLDKDITKLDYYREGMEQFYECSLERDKAFVKNIKFTDHDRPNSIIITGGFHTQNLRELFKNENVSYVSIMPKFTNPPGYESPYLKRLAGQRTALENVIDTAIPAVLNLQVVEVLSTKLAIPIVGEKRLKVLKLAIQVVAFLNRLEELKKNGNVIVRVKDMGKQKEKKEDEVIVFPSGGGGTGEGPWQVSTLEAKKAIDRRVYEIELYIPSLAFKVISPQPQGQAQVAPVQRAPLPKTPPAGGEEKPGLIGKLIDKEGNVITSTEEFTFKVSEEGGKITITSPRMKESIDLFRATNILRPSITPQEFAESLNTLINQPNTLTPNEKYNIQEMIKTLGKIEEIVPIKPDERIKGILNGKTLYLSENLVNAYNTLSIIHEMGENSKPTLKAILKNAVERRDLTNERVPGLKGLTYGEALTTHTAWRGPGKDARNAFVAIAVSFKKESKDINKLSPNELIRALEAKMREPQFVMSEARTKAEPLTNSEKALIHYNFAVGRRGEALLYGLQDHIDHELNMAFTQGIRIMTNDLRQNMMNIFIMRATAETKAPQSAVGRELAGKFDKKYGINTGILYFEKAAEIGDKLRQAVGIAMSAEYEGKLPKIMVNCMSQQELNAARVAINKMKKEDEFKKLDLDNMIAKDRDFRRGEIKTGLSIPDEVRVITTGSLLMNDRRLRVDFKMSAQELFEARKNMLEFLVGNEVISEKINGKNIRDITAAEADLFDVLMDRIWKGLRYLQCTRIDWHKLDEWKDSMRKLLQAV